ncbi:MAG: substrate-binding domain-containing protein [Spirochaetales bacterium]|nr:substrate-binding domain-containing protein [Spirochaetales bacterium]
MSRRTIGLIIPSLHLPWEDVQIAGIIEACEEADINLIILPGGRLDSREIRESSRNVIYSLVDNRNIDGLIIWTAGLSELVSPERLEEFISSFEPVPIVLLDCRHRGYDHIYADSYHPMKELITHLIKDHSLSSIGYIPGEVGHPMADDRFRAYRDALEEADIPFRGDFVFNGVNPYDEELEIGRLIDWYNDIKDQLRGVAVFNDRRAIQFIGALNRIGVRVPEDLALCSYDDTPDSLYNRPYLSTVHSPFREIGREGVKTIIEKMNGNSKLPEIEIKGEVLIRESCGCRFQDSEENRRKVENLTKSLGEKMRNIRLVNSLRADLKASPDFLSRKDNFNKTFSDFLIRSSIPLCKIYLYKSFDEKDLSENYSFSNGSLDKPSEQTLTLGDLKYRPGIPRGDRFTFIVLPLFSREVNFGFALVEKGTGDGDMYETLMYILGSYFEENRLLSSLQQQSDDLKLSNDKLSTTVENLNATRNLLVQSEKIAALSHLTGGIAHQLNTPLGVAITAVSYLDSCYEAYRDAEVKDKEQKGRALIHALEKSLPIATQNLKRTAELVSTFKNIAMENISGDKGVIVADLYIREQMNSFSALWNDRISTRVNCGESFSIEVFPGVLSQILSILVENSVLHCESEKSRPFISVDISGKGKDVIIDYSDDGPGIPREVRGRIFDPFFSTKGGNQNPGLGLFIVHNLVTYKLKGSIEVIDSFDGGACFRIVLPGRSI